MKSLESLDNSVSAQTQVRMSFLGFLDGRPHCWSKKRLVFLRNTYKLNPCFSVK